MLSSYFVVCYLGLSVPVIGIGVASELTSLATASVVFAGVVTLLAAIALVLGARTLAGAEASGPTVSAVAGPRGRSRGA